MKKYLLVLSSLELGGAERQAINLAKYLKKNGREVTILGLSRPGVICKICEDERIPYVVLTDGNKWLRRVLRVPCFVASRFLRRPFWPREISLMYTLSKYIKVNEMDICISYCSYANMILGCCKKRRKESKYVWFQRDAGIFDSTEGYQRRAIHNVDYIFANGNSGKEWIKRGYGLDATVIYNGVSLQGPQKSVKEWKEILEIEETDVVCTMVANLSSAKDHMSLLKAWKILHEQKQDEHIILVFAGRFDDQYENLYKYAVENDLLEQVRFLGQVEDITGLLYASSIGVFGAISEGSPNGIIEPAIMGLPVVATDLPEIREVLAENNYEYLFDKGDINAISKKVLRLSIDRELRQYLGSANKIKAENMFSADVNFAKAVSIVENHKLEVNF